MKRKRKIRRDAHGKDCTCGKGQGRSGRCRISRPLCRKMRRLKGLCGCCGYHYPHRKGSGLCEHSPRASELRNRILYGVA